MFGIQYDLKLPLCHLLIVVVEVVGLSKSLGF